MLQFSPLRTAIILVVAVLAILFAIPNFLPKDTLAAWPGCLPQAGHDAGPRPAGRLAPAAAGQPRDRSSAERIKELRRDARSLLANQNGIGNIITTQD